MTRPRQIVVGITGASGAVYARRLVECLVEEGAFVHLVVTPNGRRILADELDCKSASPDALIARPSDRVAVYPPGDVGACIASGSFPTDGMIVVPCSVNTLGAIASGTSPNLLTRAAAVTLKEARRLVLVVREMPLSVIDLRNALECSRAGAVICPASPGFYLKPHSLEDIVDFVVGRVLDLVGVPHKLNTRWTGETKV
jgi:4-hydroxy-3-polyprenylbenzoate decarboxylase